MSDNEVYCHVWTCDGRQTLTWEQWQNFDNNKLYRTNGPSATFCNGDKVWYLHGKLHRTDGPATILNGGRLEGYWIDDIPLDDEQANWMVENCGGLDTQEIKVALKLKWPNLRIKL